MDAGHITICLGQGLSIRSTRPANIGVVFAGRRVADVARLMPLLFAVCSRAQTQASQWALAMAAGETPDSTVPAAVTAEAIREHMMRIAVDWAKALNQTPDTTILRRIHALPKQASEGTRGDVAHLADELLAELVAGRARLAAGDWSGLLTETSLAGRLLHHVVARGWSDWGRSASSDPAETSAFTLVRDDPAMAALVAQHGDGLLPRLSARLVHLARLIETLADGGAKARLHRHEGWGEATLPTSRGLLTHRVKRADDLVIAYDIIAPTDINFRPHGIAAASLKSFAPSTDEQAMRLMVEAIDPCVSYSFTETVSP